MFRIVTALLAAALLMTTGAVAHAEYSGAEIDEVPLSPATPSAADTVISIGATTSMNDHEAIVAVPGAGKIVATANTDVFCAGEETARSVLVEVAEAGEITLDICEAHLERRDVVIRFVPAN